MQVVMRKWNDLRTSAEVHDLAKKYKALNIRRRRINDWVADAVWFFDGKVFSSKAREIDVELVRIDHHLQSENDASCRWYSDFLLFADSPPKQKMHASLRRRYTLLWLAMALYCARK